MDKIRVGIVGAGFGSYGLLPAFRRDERCDVTAIATSRATSRLGVYRVFPRWEELVESREIDAIAIATPPAFQPAIALAALSLRKPVFAEKPLAATLADADMLWKAADESQCANVVDFLFPELAVFAEAKRLIDEGGIGIPMHITAEWIFWSADHRRNDTTWRTDYHAGGGALAHFGSHMIYYIQWLLGPFRSIAARVTKPADYRHSGDTFATMMLAFENGASGTLTISSGSPAATRHSIEILGTAGSLVLSNESFSNPTGFTLRYCDREGVIGNPITEPTEAGVDCRVPAVSRIVQRFLDWILTGQKTRPSFRDGFEVQKVIASASICGAHST